VWFLVGGYISHCEAPSVCAGCVKRTLELKRNHQGVSDRGQAIVVVKAELWRARTWLMRAIPSKPCRRTGSGRPWSNATPILTTSLSTAL